MKLSEFFLPTPPVATARFHFWISFPSRRISKGEKEVIYRQLYVLHNSGVDIRKAFEILQEHVKKASTREKLNVLMNFIERGKSLSEAMLNLRDFTSYEVQSLKIGEETGRFGEILLRLADYYREQMALTRLLTNALSYPILILTTSLGAVIFMVFLVIPMFEEVFARFGHELPALTNLVIQLSVFVRNQFLLLVLLALIFFMSFYFLRKNSRVEMTIERIILRLPIINEFYRSVHMAHFCSTMGLLTQSAIPILRALDMSLAMAKSLHLRMAIPQVKVDLIRGKNLTGAFAAHTFFDKQFVSLIQVAEETNELGGFFLKLSEDYTNSLKHRMQLIATFLEPALIIFLGILVGVILVSMYLPMFQLSSSIQMN